MTVKLPHILVVDDDWMNREVIEAYLLTKHYRVTTTHNGRNAIKIAEEDPPDLLLLDILLPDMTGYEVCAHFKNNEKTRFIPVIIVTALESDEDRLKAIEAGADDFVTKPFNSLLMLTRVKSLLRLKQLSDEVTERTDLLQKVLNRYVDKEIAEVILLDPDRYLKLGGETRRVTVSFADLSGFTAFSENHSAQEVISVLNLIFSKLTTSIFQFHGTLDKYIGDEIMAFYGAPIATGDDTLNAVVAAWHMQQTFHQIRQGLISNVSHMTIEFGIHTGEAVVGNVGSERAMNYTVIGDTVNTARRLVEIARNGEILISPVTYQEVADRVEVEELPPQVLPGKRDPMIAYRVVGLKT